MQGGVGEGEPHGELERAQSIEQIVKTGLFPTLAQAASRQHVVSSLPVAGPTARDSAADDDSRVGGPSPCDNLLVLALECRIWDLECVEDTHLNLLNEIGQGARHADEAHLALPLQRQRSI